MDVWDDPPGPPPSPEAMKVTKAWFDELVESGAIKVLTVDGKYGRVTYITNGEVPRDDRRGD